MEADVAWLTWLQILWSKMTQSAALAIAAAQPTIIKADKLLGMLPRCGGAEAQILILEDDQTLPRQPA
jgi:hypothetical protein